MEELPSVITDRARLLLPVGVILLCVAVLSRVFSSHASDIPLLGKEYGSSEQRRKEFLKNAPSLYTRGHEMFKNGIYRLSTPDGDRVIIPNSALDELRKYPDDHVDHIPFLQQATEKKHTGVKGNQVFLNHMVRSDLTRSLNRINPRLSGQAEKAINDVIGPCEDWTVVPIHKKLLAVIAIVSGNVFLGPDLCRRPEYLHASINYTVDLMIAVRALRNWSDWLRPVVKHFIPEYKKLIEHRRRAVEFLLPVIRQRKEAMERGEEMPDDMLQWQLNKADEFNMTDEMLAEGQLSLSFAAIHTTTITLTQILNELVIRPEVVDEIRADISKIMEDNEGVINTRAILDMKLLDSVMRETMRANPTSEGRFNRYIRKPLTLKSGLRIPAGVFIEAAHRATLSDASNYASPETFDPHRFVKLRTGSCPDPIGYKNREQYQFVAVTKEHMAFGFGAHACPGRFFAANEIKLIVAHLLMNYDMRMAGGATEKPQLIRAGATYRVNPETQFEMRRVRVEA